MIRSLPRRLAAAALVIAAAACTPLAPGAGSGGPSPVAQIGPVVDPNGKIIVAVLTPGGGTNPEHAVLGAALANAARMAAAEAADPLLELRFYDTAADPATAAAMTTRALDEGAVVIVGDLFAATSAEVGRIATPRGVTVLSLSTDTTIAGGTLSVIGYAPEGEAARILEYAKRQGVQSIGLFYPQTPYGEAALRGTQAAATAHGLQIGATAGYARSFEGIQAAAPGFAQTARAAGVQAVLLPDGGQGLRSVAAFMDNNGLDPAQVRFLGLGQWNAPLTLQEAALKGGLFPAPEPGSFEAFSSRYAGQFGAAPPFVAALAYDGVQVVAQLVTAARAAKSTAPFSPPALTRAEGFQGALGPLRIGADGLAQRAMAILSVGDGGFVRVEPSGASFAAGS